LLLKRLRAVFYLGCLAIFAAAFYRVQAINRVEDVQIQEIATVDRGDITLTVNATGTLRTAAEAPLTFLAVGKVAAVNVREGDHVLAGQTLALLDTSSQRLQLRGAQIALDLQRIAYDALTAAPRDVDVNAARAAAAAAQAQLNAASIGVTQTELEIAALQVEVAKNAAWQSQLQRDQAVDIANRPPTTITIPPLLSEIIPDDREANINGLLNSITNPQIPGFGGSGGVNSAEANVRRTGYDVEIAQANLNATQTRGANPGGVAAAQAAIVQSQVALNALVEGADEDQIAIVKAQIDAAQAALDLANYNLSLANVIAPFDGVVAQVNLVEGESAPVDRPAIILLDDSAFFVDVAVDEIDISTVEVGQTATLALDSLPGTAITGRVSRVADTPTILGDVVTYLVRVEIDPTTNILRAGMTATATVQVDEIRDVVRVRNRFIRLDRRTGTASVVVRTPSGALEERIVTLGLRNDTYSEITSGLSVGEMVVVLPRSFFGVN
jgi:HlyD family secretion protein